MALQVRFGPESKYDGDKMITGEWAVSTDTRYVRMCFAPGIVYRMATYESFEEDMLQIQQILATCEDIQTAVEAFEALAQQHANDAAQSASDAAQSAIDAEEWARIAEAAAGVGIADYDIAGLVKGNLGELNIDEFGKMSIPSDFTPQTTLEAVTGTENKKTFFGKVAKVIADFLAHAANLSIHFGLTNNLLATEAGTALDAVQGKALDDKITTNGTAITDINNRMPQSSNVIRTGATTINCLPNTISSLDLTSTILSAFGWTNISVLIPVLHSSIPNTLSISNMQGVLYVYNNSAAQYDNVIVRYLAIGK